MNFAENLQALRKYHELTQEGLAERLNVSRQSVSKWESALAYPEMDTIIQLCDIFSCNMDTLLRGDIAQWLGKDHTGYDNHMNRFARSITAGVALTLGGITGMLMLNALAFPEYLSAILFFLCLAAAAVIFIMAGMGHSSFIKANPVIDPFYTPDQIAAYDRKFPKLIAFPVGLILIGVALVVLLGTGSNEQWDSMAVSTLLLCVTIGASVLVWAGIQKYKYNIAAYNKEHSQPPTQAEQRTGALWGAGMVAATAVFVGLGLLWELWDRAWVIYPVAALLCVAATIYINRNENV